MNTIRVFIISGLLMLSACNSTSNETKDAANADVNLDTSIARGSATGKEMDSNTHSFDKTDEFSKIAYAMGANSGQFLASNLPEFKNWGMDFDAALIKQGFLDSLEEKSLMDEQEVQTVLLGFQEKIKTKLAEIEQQKAKVTAQANTLFLDANSAKDGVKVTASGLQYRIITLGTGAAPSATDRVLAHYRGSLINGEEFDSSYVRDKPSEFALNGVIAGWTEGLQLIKEGGKIELVLPPEIAYGERALPQIPANSVLVFEVELISIVKSKAVEGSDIK